MPDIDQMLDEMAARCDAATPGPWKHRAVEALEKWPGIFVNEIESPRGDACWIAKVMDHRNCAQTRPGDQNAAFIAASRTDQPRLIAAMRVALAELRDALPCEQYAEALADIEAALRGDAK